MVAPLLAAAARAFGPAAARLGASGGRLGAAARGVSIAREGYRMGGVVTGDPRAIIGAAMNCDSPGEAMAILARAKARSVTGRLAAKVEAILDERGCLPPGGAAIEGAAGAVLGAAGTVAGVLAGGAVLAGAAAWGAMRQPSEGNP